MSELEILYEDNHLLVVNKPAGIATMGVEAGGRGAEPPAPTVHRLACDYLKRVHGKPGNAFVGIVSRLDTVTSGVLALAKTSKAASRLASQFGPNADPRRGEWPPALKLYLAAVEGDWPELSGQRASYLWKDDAARRMRTSRSPRPGAQEAQLRFAKLGQSNDASFLAVRLLTGRKHQIRAEFSDAGFPIWGDRKYGSGRRFPAGIALHSWRLRMTHPTRKVPLWFAAEPPASWRAFRRWLGDDEALWERLPPPLIEESG